MDAQLFHEIVSGRRRGVLPACARGAAWLAQWGYFTGVACRNRAFEKRRRSVHKAEVPVVSVGNITVGGTGKTPMVAWIAKHLRAQGVRVSLISRGYGAQAGGRNDEALELEHRLPDVPHLQNPDRVAAAQVGMDELHTQLILLDDGFQHRRLHRDCDIVLVDATCPFGHGHLLPRGLLREPLASLRRAHAVVLTRANLVGEDIKQQIKNKVRHFAPHAAWCEAEHAPAGLLSTAGLEQPLETLRGGQVLAFCGIGNPDAFFQTLEQHDINVADRMVFPDHCPYDRDDVAKLQSWIDRKNTPLTAVVCTHKDLVKLRSETLSGVPLVALVVDMRLSYGRDNLVRLLQPQIERALQRE